VRWYLRYKLSYRDLLEMMAERGLAVAHTTIMRWVQRYVPVFEKRWNRYARMTRRSWRVDETYVKIRGPSRSTAMPPLIGQSAKCLLRTSSGRTRS
jgi:transposase-like protein